MSRPEVLAEIALHADRLNFGTLLIPEHVVVFEQYASRYPYTDSEVESRQALNRRVDTFRLNESVIPSRQAKSLS